MFDWSIALLVIFCAIGGIMQGLNNIKLTRNGTLPPCSPSKDNIVFIYTDIE